MQSNAYWAILAALVLGQSGCTSLLGQRYFDGAEFACAECEQAPQLAGEAGVVPPHSRYHPVPTRPVFSPQPQAVTVTVATHSALVSEEKVAQRAEVKKPTQRVARAPVTAPTAPNLRTAGAIQRWMSETEPSMAAKPVAQRCIIAASRCGRTGTCFGASAGRRPRRLRSHPSPQPRARCDALGVDRSLPD